jgi:oleate hydratase
MYYSSGNYEAFARPENPEGVRQKVGVSDRQRTGITVGGMLSWYVMCRCREHIFIFWKRIRDSQEERWTGIRSRNVGYVMRGGREMDNHFECMWDLFRSIPSIETDGVSILDEYYWLNKKDPNYSLCRATQNRGEDAHTDKKFGLSDKGCMEIMKLFMTPDEKLANVKMTELFDDEVFNTNFWLYWRTMFAFKDDQSALEMKRYMQRYIHHIGGLPDFTALSFTKYNQYESMVLPMVRYLKDHGVQFPLQHARS